MTRGEFDHIDTEEDKLTEGGTEIYTKICKETSNRI